MSLINCEAYLILTQSVICFITASTIDGQVPLYLLTDTKCYAPVVTLSTQDNAKLLQQLKLRFKGTINWNKFQ